MISINFWNFSKRKNSTALPSGTAVSYNCEIKEPSDLTSPQLLLNLGQSEAPAYNYAQIPAFSRYYFITEWRFDRGLWIASLQVDVLASYRTEIGNQSMYVARAASESDGNIKDLFYPTKASVYQPGAQNTTIEAGIGFSSGYYVVGVLGSNPGSGNTIYYQMSPEDFKFFVDNIFVTADSLVTWGDVANGIKNSIINPTQYLTTCRWYPHEFTHLGTAVSVMKAGLWWLDMTKDYTVDPDNPTTRESHTYRLTGATTSQIFPQITIPKHPQAAARGPYMNLAPFSRYQISWGSAYDLDPSLLVNFSTLVIRLVTDYTSTQAILKVYAGNSANNFEVMSVSVPYGVDIPLTSDHFDPGGVMQILSGSGAVIGGALTGDLAAAAAGAQSLVQGVAEFANPTLSSSSMGTGYGVSLQPKMLKAAFYYAVDDDVAEFGRPLMQTRVINTLSGFIRCQNDDVQIACLDSERDQIRGYMTGGFFYE